jgi:hypothetical protein
MTIIAASFALSNDMVHDRHAAVLSSFLKIKIVKNLLKKSIPNIKDCTIFIFGIKIVDGN